MAGRNPSLIERDKKMAELASAGLCKSDIADRLGIPAHTVGSWAILFGVKLARKANVKSQRMALREIGRLDKANRFAELYKAGSSMNEIAEKEGITRQRVHQLLKSIGVSSKDSGAKRSRLENAIEAQQAKDANCLKKYGVTRAEWKHLIEIDAIKRYRSQKRNAKNRGIPFDLTIKQWASIWMESGHYEQCGKGIGAYVMSRIGDSGGYTVGNVEIKTAVENSREAVNQWLGKTKKLPVGVFCNYPGTSKPYITKFGKVSLGCHETPELAAAFRSEYIKNNHLDGAVGIGRGRGWTFVKRLKRNPYVCQITGMKQARFATQSEAESYYKSKTAEIRASRGIS